MTYGEFAWKDLMRSALRDRSRQHDEPPTVFVPGVPVASGHAGEARWSYKVQHAVRRRMARPKLAFVVGPATLRRAGFSLRALAAPVAAAVASEPRSLWVQVRTGDRSGVAVGFARPGFPPRIDRSADLNAPLEPASLGDARTALAAVRPILGGDPVGMHVTLRGHVVDLADRTPLAVALAAVAPLLGTSPRAGEARITDLRILTDPRQEPTAELRLWSAKA